MEQRGKQVLAMITMEKEEDPIKQIKLKFKQIEFGFKSWLSKQSLPVEAAVVTLTAGLQGAAMGAIMGTITRDVSSSIPTPPSTANLTPQAMASLQQAQAMAGGPLVQARNFAVMTGVNAGISAVLKRVRGKEDVQGSMAAAFGSGVMFTLVSGVGGPNLAQNAISSGLFFALAQGGIFQMAKKFSQPPADDLAYNKARSMLQNLGLQNYEKNFKKGLLTDTTLPLLTDSALKDVNIPPGPRLIILDHVQSDAELKESRGRRA
ncbi:hypothetical protein ACFE04_011031 [Oxalis oulophora]